MSRGLRGLAVALLVATLAPAAAHAQYFGQNKVQYKHYRWRSISSDHFEVTFDDGLDSLAMRVLDLAEKTNLVLSKRMGHRLGRKVPIILYGSHNDFSQTNVTPELIDAGTGGFTEVLRNRVVLPFTGSYEDLRHVVVHELTHAYMFDMLYQGSAAALLARQSFYSIPLWFAEGMAEYMSLGMEPGAEQFLRDGTVEGYLPPLEYAGGFIVYKQGQSAISYLCSRFGEERLRDILRRSRQMRSFERAFQKSTGYTVGKFDEQWRTWLRKQYWPTVATKQAPEEFAHRLTDHRSDESNLNTAPAVSPHGDLVAFFSDRRQYTDVYIMSALDGKVLRRIIRGERNLAFESVPSFRSTMTWSPDGRELALTSRSGGRDVLYIVDASTGKIDRRFRLPCDALFDPAWSPTSDSIVVAGVQNGRSDSWLVDLDGGPTLRLTNDTFDEREPAWSPDGRTLAFSSDRTAPVVLLPGRHEQGHGRYGLYAMDLDGHGVHQVLDTAGDDRCPAWSPDGKLLAFVSDFGGAPNIFVFSTADSAVTQLTDVLGGIQSLSWSRQNDRLVFSAFNRAGYDVFAVRDPISVNGVLARLRREFPASALTLASMRDEPNHTSTVEPNHGALATEIPDSLAGRDSVSVAAHDVVGAAGHEAGAVPEDSAAVAREAGWLAAHEVPPAGANASASVAGHDSASAAAGRDEAWLAAHEVPSSGAHEAASVAGHDSASAAAGRDEAWLAAHEVPSSGAHEAAPVAGHDSASAAAGRDEAWLAAHEVPSSGAHEAAPVAGHDSASAAAGRDEAWLAAHEVPPVPGAHDSASAAPPDSATLAAGLDAAAATALAPAAPESGSPAAHDSAAASRDEAWLTAHTSGLATHDSSSTAAHDSAAVAAKESAQRDTVRMDDLDQGPEPTWTFGEPQPYPALPDTLAPLATHIELVERGGPFALPDSVLGQKPRRYRPRLAPDYGGAGFYAATGYGFVGSTQFVFSDFLGDHNLYVATDVLSNSLEETNALAIYSYLPRRWDVSLGAFHFKDYFDSQVSSLGESFGAPRLFSERNFGGLVSMAYPFDRFRRIEFNFTQMFLERQFFIQDNFGDIIESNREYRSVSSPAVSIVGDNALFGYYGPVNGQRYNLTYSPSFDWFDNGLAYHTVTFDARRYWDLTHGYTFAGRMLVGASDGRNPQTFRVGGFSTIRGYPDFSLLGNRLAIGQLELRFPFIHQLGVVGPLPIGLLNLRGALFSDFGPIWNRGDELRFTHVVDGKTRLLDPQYGPGVAVSFGTGLRTSVLYMILKFDVAWRTDMVGVSRPRWHFSIGPEF